MPYLSLLSQLPNTDHNIAISATITATASYEFIWATSLIPRPLSYALEAIKKQLAVTEHDASSDREDQCAVCLAAVEAKQLTRELQNCNHVFHKQCLDAWIDNNNVTCPLCRADLLYQNGVDFVEAMWTA